MAPAGLSERGLSPLGRHPRPRRARPVLSVERDQERDPPLPRVAPPAPRRPVAPPAIPRTERFTAAPRPARRPAPEEPAPPRRTREPRWLALVGVLAVGAAVAVGVASLRPEPDDPEVATGTPDPKHPPPQDVSLDRCVIDRDGVTVGGSVRNPTDDPADYVIGVQLVAPDGAVITSADSTAPAIARPGTRTEWNGRLPAVATNAPSGTCKLVKVDRFRR